MKILWFFLVLILVGVITGCSVTEQTPEDIENKVQEGLTGRGKIVPNTPMSDSFGPSYR